jgi:Nucleotidyl transferase AbiEii toxin, Type IV TA system
VEPFDTVGSSPEPDVFPYASAAAFRTALRDRFAVIAKSETRYSLDELQRQFAYDRALARLFTAPDAASWVLKGAGALLARLEHARHSKDIDVYFAERSAAVSDAILALRRNLSRDLGDFFGFEVTRIVPLQEEAKGSRVHVRASLGAKTFAVFHIDVVVGTVMSGEPDEVAPLTPLHMAGLVRPAYRAFPLPDHVADKFAAILGSHIRGDTVTGSSRIKDLVDIALIATTQQISGPALRAAVLAGTAHRDLSLPDAFAVPDEAVWRRAYLRSAADAPGPTPTFDEAVSLACALLNPVLKGPVIGNWDPAAASWTSPPR